MVKSEVIFIAILCIAGVIGSIGLMVSIDSMAHMQDSINQVEPLTSVIPVQRVITVDEKYPRNGFNPSFIISSAGEKYYLTDEMFMEIRTGHTYTADIVPPVSSNGKIMFIVGIKV